MCSSRVRGEKSYTPVRGPQALKPKFVKVGPASVRPRRMSNSEGVHLGEGFGVLEPGAWRKKLYACSWAPRLEAKVCNSRSNGSETTEAVKLGGCAIRRRFWCAQAGCAAKKVIRLLVGPTPRTNLL